MSFESPEAFTVSAGAFGEDTGAATAGAVTSVVLGVSVIGSSQALEVSAPSQCDCSALERRAEGRDAERRVLQGSLRNLRCVAGNG